MSALEQRQAPRYGALGGDGDFLFIPSYAVLNPRLIAPLYLSGPPYADLRQSACIALQRFIASQPKKEQRDLAAQRRDPPGQAAHR